MPSCHHPLTARRLGCLLIGILWTGAAAGQTPTREYIYFGGRAIAIENPPPPPIVVTVSPSSATVASGGTVQFTKTVTGTSNQNVTWSVVDSGGGTIDQNGLYTAPTVSTQLQFTIRATSQADSTKFGSATVTVNPPPPPPCVITVTPANATVQSGQELNYSAAPSNCSGNSVVWEASGGSISSTGLLTAKYIAPAVSSQTDFTITAKLENDQSKSGSTTVTVTPPCTVNINPTSATVYSGRKQTLQATTSNCGAAGVTWTLGPGAGTLSASGLTATYTAPQGVVSTQTATVQASVNGFSATATALITIQPSQPPALSTMSPNNSSGTRQQFALTVSDAQGQADIAGLQVVFLSDWAYTCQISFNAEFNLLGFRLDNGTWTDVPLGGAQAPTNSYCTLYAATSSVTRSGNQLTLTLDLQFKPIFSGQKSVLAAASDYAGNVVGYQEVGKWLVPGVTGTSQSSIIQFWTPSQVYPGQPFQVALTVRNTGQNIWQSSGLNSSQPHRLVSWNPRATAPGACRASNCRCSRCCPGRT